MGHGVQYATALLAKLWLLGMIGSEPEAYSSDKDISLEPPCRRRPHCPQPLVTN